MTQHHVLYRMFDEDGALLYIGLTKNPSGRLKQHSESKDWWGDVETVRLQSFPTREELIAAERMAIQDERPAYNIVHNNAREDDDEPDLGPFRSYVEEEDYEDFLMYAALAKSDIDLRLDPEADGQELFGLYYNEAREACPPEKWIPLHGHDYTNAISVPSNAAGDGPDWEEVYHRLLREQEQRESATEGATP